jgi:hypothetical protein
MNRFPLRVALPALGGVGAAVALLAVLLTGSAPAALSRGAVLDHSTTGKASVITVIAGKPRTALAVEGPDHQSAYHVQGDEPRRRISN